MLQLFTIEMKNINHVIEKLVEMNIKKYVYMYIYCD